MTSQEAFDALCNWVNVAITGNSADYGRYLEYLDVSHLSITSNGILIEEETVENLLGVLP